GGCGAERGQRVRGIRLSGVDSEHGLQPSPGRTGASAFELPFGCARGGVGRGGPVVGRGGVVAHPARARAAGGAAHAGPAADLLVGGPSPGPGRWRGLRSAQPPLFRVLRGCRERQGIAVNSRRRVSAALIGLLVLVAGGWLGRHALSDPPGGDGGSSVAVAPGARPPMPALSPLAPQAGDVWRLIQRGGPFPYRQDGMVFGNREGRLPARQAGFYREYTVPTPREPDRGPRRLITGGVAELYYTGDHYRSFVV